jgi:hypothetical protein
MSSTQIVIVLPLFSDEVVDEFAAASTIPKHIHPTSFCEVLRFATVCLPISTLVRPATGTRIWLRLAKNLIYIFTFQDV